MKFIDKRRFHDREHSINVRFLKDCYTQDITNPLPSPDNPKRSFDDFKKDVYRGGKRGIDGWLDLLLEEQECRCCYCMKKLDSLNLSKINIEHVIPRSLNGDNGRSEYNYYTSKSEILHDYVMMSDEFAQKVFTNTDDIDREEKMPHITALANLLAACNGKQNFIHTKMCCCNNHRGDKRILPLMLMSQDDNAVIYDKNGLIIINEDDGTLKDTIIRDLNDKTLQDIR